MMFSVMPRETIKSPWGQALQAWRSAFTLYVAGTRFGLLCHSVELLRLLDDFGDLRPLVISATMH
ncbi:hypothetical protein LPU83_pLPU83d_0948 (plasmid) [Rhizobium favelukesii]|uniref:Uncharacterized protein n=1 Tax=Rhizobium favelukesii TaxID=348824 RepID=W6RUF6_9HYPH|nr:hypothetical protein LPU83_pLPU83d_0948 [Rhizobium favelukesii]